MSKRFFVGLLVAGLLLGCGDERRQQRNMAKDLNAIKTAAVMHVELPSLPEVTFNYGRGAALMKELYEHYVQLSKAELELLTLIKGSDPWTYPLEWADSEKLKEYRKDAERLLVVLEEYRNLVDETTGSKALQSIQASGLGWRGKGIFTDSIQSQAVLSERTREIIRLVRSWDEKEVELLTLLDENRESMDGTTPIFPELSQAEQFRKLLRAIQDERQFLTEPLARFEDAQARYLQQLQTEARKL
jgi:hypothetical protein